MAIQRSLYAKFLGVAMLLSAPFALAEPLRQWLRYKIALLSVHVPRPDDIFIASFPKSGTTLMQMMLYQLTSDGSMEIPHIDSVCPWFEYEFMNHRGDSTQELFAALPSPRIFKTHMHYDDLPRQGRFIYIARGLRDVIASFYHHRRLMTGRDPDRNRVVNMLLRPRVALVSWFKSLESWWPHWQDENVLFLTYEEAVRDLEGTVRKVAAFCQIEIDPSSLPRILERCSLGFMKQHWDKFDPRLRRVVRTQTEFIRQGRVGTGAKELTAEEEDLANRRIHELAAKLGCAPGDPHSEIFA